jgi:signal transduction histidine kinase
VENQHHTSIEDQGISRRFIVNEELRTFFQNEIYPKIESELRCISLNGKSIPIHDDIYLTQSANGLIFTFKHEQLIIPFWKSNITKIPILVINWLHTHLHIPTENHGKIKKISKTSEKKLSLIIPSYNDWALKKLEIAHLYKNNPTLQSLPLSLLNLTPFVGFLSAHILIHLKGESQATSLNYNKNTGFKDGRISVADFNRLFSIIKKSKNKSFTKEQIIDLEMPLVGAFLAKEVLLTRHNVILVISRNDFLLPTKYEINFFERFTLLLPKYIEHLIEMQQNHVEQIRSFEIMNSLPMAYCILRNAKLIFKNAAYKDEYENSPPSFELKEPPFEIRAYELDDSDRLTTDLFHHQRISLLGELLNTLKHEISNPLFGLKLATDLLDRRQFHPDDQISIEQISSSIIRCQLIIESFSNLYTSRSSTQVISLRKIIDEILTLTKSETRGILNEINFNNFNSADLINIKINPTWLAQILFNIIINSAQALKNDVDNKSKKFSINIFNEADHIKIDICDNGPGINKELIDLIFNPFFTTKKSGTGLGLSISKNLALRMGAELTCHNLEPRGICFSLILRRNGNENTHN